MRLSTAGSTTPDVEPEVIDDEAADPEIAGHVEDETAAYQATHDETVAFLQADEAPPADRRTGDDASKSGPGDAPIGSTP